MTTTRSSFAEDGSVSTDDAGSALSLRTAMMRQELRTRLFGEDFGTPVMLGPHRLQRVLGLGGMGVVFSAIDERTQQEVALKVLHRGIRAARQVLKREFRALANLTHPNLVALHELYLESDASFFTMERIHGEDLLSYIRPTGALDHTRLRTAMAQLVHTVGMLHAAGRVHGDLKPSNLMVQADGRLVVLDFGLSRAIGDETAGRSGTPGYLAPERFAEGQSDEAADWYSTGVILYEAFTERLPHASVDDLVSGHSVDCDALLSAGASSALASLVARLLSVSRGQRPGITELTAAFGRHPSGNGHVRFHAEPGDEAEFVGRERELRELWAAFAATQQGQSTMVRVHGDAGIGKSTLIGEFLRRLAQSDAATLLVSRCHEREYISYNAVDGLIDAIVRHERASPVDAGSDRAPEGASELARLFPALRKLPAFRRNREALALDPHRSRRLAFGALRAILQRMAAARPLVLHFDDLQWGDADSAELLSHALCPSLSRMMIIATYRTADSSASCIHALTHSASSTTTDHHELALKPLVPSESLSLARHLGRGLIGTPILEALSDEAGGSPLLLRLLVQHQRHGRAAEPGGGLRGALQRLIDDLPAPRRMLLEILAVSGAPLNQQVLLGSAVELGAPPSVAEELFALFQAGLVRSASSPIERRLEPYHQRLAEAIEASTSPENAILYHRTLARTVAGSSELDPEFVAHHFERAGELDEAGRFAELAGDRALAGLALEHASQSYAQALRCHSGARPSSLVAKLADTLAYIGRCAEAAPLYLEAANSLGSAGSLLRVHAAEMYMRMGEQPRGDAAAKPIFRDVGVHYPSTYVGAKLAFFSALLHLKVRMLWPARSNTRLSTDESQRVDMCFELGRVLALIGSPIPTALLLKSLLIALEGGSDAQLARGIASYAWVLTALSSGSAEYRDQLLETASDLAMRSGDADARAWVLFCRAICASSRSELRLSCKLAGEASQWIAERCADSGWLLTEIESGPLTNLFLMGSLQALDVAAAGALERARKQGNRFHADVTLAHQAIVWLAREERERSSCAIKQVLASWEPNNFCRAPALAAAMLMYSLLYRGDSVAAATVGRRYARRYRRYGYLSINAWAHNLIALYGTISLACAFRTRSRRRRREVRAAIARLTGRPLSESCCASPLADLLAGGLARLGGNRDAAVACYLRAALRFDELDMCSHAAAARVRLAELLPIAQARDIRRQADAWAEREGIHDLDAWARLYAPGPITASAEDVCLAQLRNY
jgi:eukaryotic-like serine/threonine-protein kinase